MSVDTLKIPAGKRLLPAIFRLAWRLWPHSKRLGLLENKGRQCRIPASAMRGTEMSGTIMLRADTKHLKATVLVIDDSPEVQRYLRFVLELDHYRVEVADDGQEGLARLRDGCAPAVVLLDMEMPGLNGLQTLQRLRELHPALKVIMCSAEDDPDIIRQATLLGAHAYLVKPVQHLYLSAALEQCLNGQTGSQPIRPHVIFPPSTQPYGPN
jgi:CheY-like chemotaxis protein